MGVNRWKPYLRLDEEALIRAMRYADFQTAQEIFDRMKAQRVAEDSAIVRELAQGREA